MNEAPIHAVVTDFGMAHIVTDFGMAHIETDVARRLTRQNRRGHFDRRYRTAARDERYVAKIMASVRQRWEAGENGPYTYGQMPLSKLMKLAQRRGIIR